MQCGMTSVTHLNVLVEVSGQCSHPYQLFGVKGGHVNCRLVFAVCTSYEL